jgi:hypothetical protein
MVYVIYTSTRYSTSTNRIEQRRKRFKLCYSEPTTSIGCVGTGYAHTNRLEDATVGFDHDAMLIERPILLTISYIKKRSM